MSNTIYKTDVVKTVSQNTGLSQKDATAALNSILEGIKSSLTQGKKITLIGFGTFSSYKTKARKGRNPQTGKEINIASSKRVRFSAGKALKDTVN